MNRPFPSLPCKFPRGLSIGYHILPDFSTRKAEFESFQDNLLEHPHYSRPETWHEKKVPEVLLSGHHANIEKWRREQSVIRTAKRRPDLLEGAELTPKEKELARQCRAEMEKRAGETL